jgi:hypothetical protein
MKQNPRLAGSRKQLETAGVQKAANIVTMKAARPQATAVESLNRSAGTKP